MSDINTKLGRSEFLRRQFRELNDLERSVDRPRGPAERMALVQARAILFAGQQLARLADVIERESDCCKNHGAGTAAPVTGQDGRD